MKSIIVFLTIFFSSYFSNAQHYGYTNNTPDMYVPGCDPGWENKTCYGVREHIFAPIFIKADSLFAARYYLKQGDSCAFIRYSCPITNIAEMPTSGDLTRNDLVICRPCDGGPTGNSFPNMVWVDLYSYPATKIGGYLKTNYNFSISDFMVGVDYSKVYYYDESTLMYLWPKTGDVYTNGVAIKIQNGKIPDGFYVIRVYVNPLKYINESNYDNNITLLPLKIKDNIVTINDSALLNNKPIQPANLDGYAIWGNKKYVDLNWDGNGETYNIYKGVPPVLIATTNANTYRDSNLKPGFKSDTYYVESEIKGFSLSDKSQKVIKR